MKKTILNILTNLELLFFLLLIFRHKTSHMVLSIIFLEDRHKMLLHLSIFYEYQQFGTFCSRQYEVSSFMCNFNNIFHIAI
jgi:hypothetical protein